jgi:quercetin dioxygenase-like cupin family protein
MEIETLRTKHPFRKENRSLNTSLLLFDLPTLIENMKHSHTWAKGELNSMILLKSPEKQIVLTIVPDRTEIKSFQSNGSINFQIIEGKLKFHTRKESVTLDKGQSLTLQGNIKYSLTTMMNTVFLLTIVRGTLIAIKN